MTDVPTETDVLIVGAGPGGYVAAIRAARLDLDVLLVDADAPGGTCLNYGCIPSKSLLSAAGIAHEAGHRESMGIYADPYVDWEELLEWQAGVVSRLTGGVEHLCRDAGATFVHGRAEFVDDREATITTPDGESSMVAFDDAIVATGSRAIELPSIPFDGERVLSSRGVLSLPEIPRELAIVGAGYIGLELATLFAKLGTAVTVVELEDDVLPGWDDDLRSLIREHVERLGVEFAFGELASECEATDRGVRLTTETEAGEETVRTADRAVVAVGREPVTDTVGLDAIDLEPGERGFLETDDRCRTDRAHVFAVGDVAGEPMLAHKASAEGEVAAETIAGREASMADRLVPAVIFTDPEVATIGVSENEAAVAGHDRAIGRMPFAASGRALAADRPEGFVRVVVDRESESLLGAQIVGDHASELVGELGLAIQAGLDAGTVAEAIHAHPTLSEAVMEACANAIGTAIHVPE